MSGPRNRLGWLFSLVLIPMAVALAVGVVVMPEDALRSAASAIDTRFNRVVDLKSWGLVAAADLRAAGFLIVAAGGLIGLRLALVRVHLSYLAAAASGGPVPRTLRVMERGRAYLANEEFIGDHPEWVERLRVSAEAGRRG